MKFQCYSFMSSALLPRPPTLKRSSNRFMSFSDQFQNKDHDINGENRPRNFDPAIACE